MTAIETVMVMDLALRAGNQMLAQNAYCNYLADADELWVYYRRVQRVAALLRETGIKIDMRGRWVRQ